MLKELFERANVYNTFSTMYAYSVALRDCSSNGGGRKILCVCVCVRVCVCVCVFPCLGEMEIRSELGHSKNGKFPRFSEMGR